MGSELTTAALEQALGAVVAASISYFHQCLAALRKADQMEGMEHKPENIGSAPLKSSTGVQDTSLNKSTAEQTGLEKGSKHEECSGAVST